MVINRAGSLRKEYFISYIKLIMNAYSYQVEEAKELVFQHLFGLQEDRLGHETYQQFLQAYRELKGL
ncbi:hypothetical protein SAMN05877753_10688 [Bacillus oleivorans]|uniref:Uncharacterized protein n=1 Tax=Bacillus oleivorans TaxID=1448271 RepID=A0A285CY39_9BACI|nr:hypothetical protein [Bacillus oleivorans]SNX72507.1 hypothetical protein SAMN05877753_10688 [Bacillus oleivorans]